jgi:RNA polymerase sigma-70 factor, ECF subfamily
MDQFHHLDDVDDLAQDVFLAALEGLPMFRRGEDFGVWLRGIARHKLQNYYRSRIRRSQALSRFREEVGRVLADHIERAAALDQADDIDRLLVCIARLPEKLRRVVRAGLAGSKPDELAGELSTTVAAVYNLHYRANQLLRDCLRKGLT